MRMPNSSEGWEKLLDKVFAAFVIAAVVMNL